jgi:AcrR family transcriptional regulator
MTTCCRSDTSGTSSFVTLGRMPPDSSATKARILDAAFREFAAHGLAGARVDRIAATAKANKRAIYAYFGNKEALFDIVLAAQLPLGVPQFPSHRTGLAAYAGDLVDYYAADPDRARLASWRQLERPAAGSGEGDAYRTQLASHRAGHDDNDALDPVDLLAIIAAIGSSWFLAPTALRESAADAPASQRRLTQHREAVVTAVRRILDVGSATAPDPDPTKAPRPDPPMDSLF